MSLLELPSETLIQIFDDVGSSYFRSDLSRLTVCKQWSKFAYTACFRKFHVTQKTLRRLLSLLYVESSLPPIKDSVEILTLDLKGFEDWDSLPLSQHDWRSENDQFESIWNGCQGYVVRTAWPLDLNIDLLYLATVIKQSRKLRILRIRATSGLHPRLRLLGPRDYLFLTTICAFLSTENLTSLELDLSGTWLVPYQRQEHSEGSHVCTSIAALLTTLRRLRLRMRSICTDVLIPLKHSTNLRLNEMLINLSLFNEPSLTTATTHTICCSSSTRGFLQLKADMEKQARVLVTQMAAPRMVRILTHVLPNIKTLAYDVLTGKSVQLSEGAEWDDSGEVIEEQVSDEKSQVSDLSSVEVG
jgi:hypothetical protein